MPCGRVDVDAEPIAASVYYLDEQRIAGPLLVERAALISLAEACIDVGLRCAARVRANFDLPAGEWGVEEEIESVVLGPLANDDDLRGITVGRTGKVRCRSRT